MTSQTQNSDSKFTINFEPQHLYLRGDVLEGAKYVQEQGEGAENGEKT